MKTPIRFVWAMVVTVNIAAIAISIIERDAWWAAYHAAWICAGLLVLTHRPATDQKT